MHAQTQQYYRILISRMKFIGDVVLTTPIIRSVRNACPGAFIAYMGEKNAVSLLDHNPFLNEIIAFDFGRPTVFEQSRVALHLRRREFDLAIDLYGNPRSALLTAISGARVRVGPARKGRGRFYTVQVKDDEFPKTAVEFHNRFIEAAGIEPSADRTEIFLTEDEKREARIYLQWFNRDQNPIDLARPIVGIHPGATWPAKKWLAERFSALADHIAAKLGAQVLVTAGPDDGETVKAVVGHTFSNVTVFNNLPLRQLAAIISHCSVFVSNDAAPMHIAAAVGTPTIGLFGPGEENIWFPYSGDEGHHALRREVACHPCHLDFCNRPGDQYMECMKLLTHLDVFVAVEKALHVRRGGRNH